MNAPPASSELLAEPRSRDAIRSPTAAEAPAPDALLQAIYGSALEADFPGALHEQLLLHFRDDRCRDDAPFTRQVLGHIKRALRLRMAHSAMQREREQLQDVIDTVAPPIVVFDDALRVLGLSREPDAMLNGHVLFSVRQGLLDCHDPALWRELMRQTQAQGSGCMRLSEDGPWVYLYRNPVGAANPGPASYALLVVDRQQAIQRAIDELARRVGLTAREAEIVDLTVQGFTLDALCERLQVTLHTLRQHIKNIYAKTGVHHQNALLALVLGNVVFTQAISSHNPKLIPHLTGLAHSRLLRLPDGRQLSYAEYGAPQGRPVLYFHALTASRLELLLHSERLRELGVRLIALDRPGVGHSSYVEWRDYRQFTGDVAALLDALGLDRVDVLSASAGTAHAVHTAWALPARVRSVHCTAVVPPIEHIMASDSPSTLNGVLTQVFRLVPSLLRPAMELAMFGQTVESLMKAMTAGQRNNAFSLTDSDIAYISEPQRLPYFVASKMESLRQGVRGWAMESLLINRPWSIDVSALRVPVHLWHGGRDPLVPLDMVERFACSLPASTTLTVVDQDTHLLVFRNLDRLVEAIHAQAA
jgi:pimeloyl-ACP methyl ester carboxylesterase/DNA-binding CsgD family transcriptional regulator